MGLLVILAAWICPECAVFAPSIDELGRCAACRRPAVRVEAEFVKWYGCASHRTWHAAPCTRNDSEQCCTEVQVLGLRDAPALFPLYCPGCRRFDPKTREDGACRGCGLVPVPAPARYRSWFWCARAEGWRDDRCPDDADRRCCSERAGLYVTGVRP